MGRTNDSRGRSKKVILVGKSLAIYIDTDDRYIGMYRGFASDYYVIACLVFRWRRKYFCP